MKRFKEIATTISALMLVVFLTAGVDWLFSGHDGFLRRLQYCFVLFLVAVVFDWLLDRVSRRNSAALKSIFLGGVVFAFFSAMDWRNFRSNLLLAAIAGVLWFAFSKWGPPADNVQTLFGKSRE